jgi:hypothetical protein
MHIENGERPTAATIWMNLPISPFPIAREAETRSTRLAAPCLQTYLTRAARRQG